MYNVCCLPEINLFFVTHYKCVCVLAIHRFVYAFGFVHISPCVCVLTDRPAQLVLVLSYLPPCRGFICHSCASLWRTCRMSTASWGPRAKPYGAWWGGSLDRYGLPSTASFFLSTVHLHSVSLRPIPSLIQLYTSSITAPVSLQPALLQTACFKCSDHAGMLKRAHILHYHSIFFSWIPILMIFKVSYNNQSHFFPPKITFRPLNDL